MGLGAAFKIKIVTMVVGLGLALWAINYAKEGGFTDAVFKVGVVPTEAEAAAGESPKKEADMKPNQKKETAGSTASKGPNDDNHLSWCETRVKSLSNKSGLKIEQEGTTWKTPGKPVDNLAMEKWLGANCTLKISDSRPPTFVPTDNVELLTVEFINGEKGSFTLTPEGYYFWDGLRFRSPQLKDALDQLKKLADASK